MNTAKGLTLIEILIAMAILSIIAAIALPAYRGYITTAHESTCQNEVSAIKLAESEYFLDNNAYFPGNDQSALYTNSGKVYTPSTGEANPLTSECVYGVVPGTNSYTITAKAGPGGNLKSQNGTVIVTFTGP